ncbi:MAG TPA: hypothetical protein PKO38_01100 [Bacillota bacterium]|nr:hypothetical protein [Bacillota bacterium]
MKRDEFLESGYVPEFIQWLETKLDKPGTFEHSFYLEKAGKEWRCGCLYEAFQAYWWPFSLIDPVSGEKVSGEGFEETFAFLTRLAEAFRRSVGEGDVAATQQCALAALEWGGALPKNRERILEMGPRICSYFRDVSHRLDLAKVTLGDHYDIRSNAGFTKLHFLLVDDLIMYDGRVGAAMGFLLPRFCEEKGLEAVPDSLRFSFGRDRGDKPGSSKYHRRDPSDGPYRFPEFTGDRWRHLNDNIKASWLLKAVADSTGSRFKELPQEPLLNKRLTALQSALFMLGYDVRTGVDSARPA